MEYREIIFIHWLYNFRVFHWKDNPQIQTPNKFLFTLEKKKKRNPHIQMSTNMSIVAHQQNFMPMKLNEFTVNVYALYKQLSSVSAYMNRKNYSYYNVDINKAGK